MVESVLLAGGGSAGHVNPLLAVADELRLRFPDAALTVLGTREGLEAELVPQRGYPLAVVPKVPLPRRPGRAMLGVGGRLREAIKAADDALVSSGAQVVVGFGGYVSAPAYLAARRRSVPVVIHEQNARPGLANRLGARWASAVAVTFPGTPLRGGRLTGLPLRSEIVALVEARRADLAASRADSRRALGLDADRRTLLVTGGSLGALTLNRAMVDALDALAQTDAQVLHLTGHGKADEVRAAVGAAGLGERYQVREYLDDMHLGLGAADLVLCRAGAGTVAELTALGVAAAYVPLAVGNGEQALNAEPAVHAGGGVVVEDHLLSGPWVQGTLLPLLADDERRDAMALAAARVGRTGAAAAVADLVEEAARGR